MRRSPEKRREQDSLASSRDCAVEHTGRESHLRHAATVAEQLPAAQGEDAGVSWALARDLDADEPFDRSATLHEQEDAGAPRLPRRLDGRRHLRGGGDRLTVY